MAAPTRASGGYVEDERGPWARELVDVVRAVSGGMLFGIPLLYTMEVWWIGSYTAPARLLPLLLLTFAVVYVLNRTSGFRSRDVRGVDALIDSVETVALGLLSVFVFLVLLREITMDTPVREALGKTVYEATPFGIGIGLAQHFLRRGRSQEEGEGDDDGAQEADGGAGGASGRERSAVHATLADVGATFIGATFIAFNIAPTDEVPMIAAAMGPKSLLALIAVSLAVSYCIVFEAGFAREDQRRQQAGLFQRPATETVVCYLLALVSSAGMLWFFQRIGGGEPWDASLSQVLVLGLPAAVGGAAGRLAT